MVERATDSYLESAGDSALAARLRFLERLWEIQSEAEAAERPFVTPDAETAKDALVTGQPLFLVSAPVVPIAEYLEVVNSVVAHVGEGAGLPAEQAEALASADFAAAVTEERLATAVRAPSEFFRDVATALGADAAGPLTPATVAFVLTAALVPFLTGPSARARETLGETGLRAWSSGRCPVCGSDAAMGRMGEGTTSQGGQRHLWCGLCHAEWEYERLRCVRCGARKPDVLRYTYVEEDPAHRLHLCDECHGYMRFVFENELRKPLSMVVEDAVSTTLDAIARDKGYTAAGDPGTSAG